MQQPDEGNPCQTPATGSVYDNAWISVHEHDVVRPGGSAGIYGVVSFKNKAIGIIPLDNELHTWLVGQWRYPLHEYSWEIPMGGGPVGVDLLTSARRELAEETGLTAARWTPLMRLHTSNSVTNEEGFVFLAEELTEGTPHFEDTEVIQIKKLPLRAAVGMVLSGQITDAISVAGLLRAAVRFDLC